MAAPAGWKTQHVEVSQIPHDPVSITLAGSGPPQRGDHFYIDAPIYAKGDEAALEIGIYRCFGAWIAAADATSAGSAPDHGPLRPPGWHDHRHDQ